MTLRALLYEDGRAEQGGIEMLARFRASPHALLWMDFSREPTPEEAGMLLEEFRFDAACVEEAHATRHPPKLELFEDQAFFLLRGFDAAAQTINFKIVHLAVFVAERLLVTRHRQLSPSVKMVWEQVLEDPSLAARGSGFLAIRLGQALAGRHLPIVLGLEERLEEIEDEIFAGGGDALLNELLSYKRQLKKLRRNAGYEAAIFARLQKETSVVFPESLRREVDDAFERFERLGSLSGLYNDLATDLMNGYLSVSSHRLNNVMKVLTIITAIFVPLSFIAGVYGMNFEYMPELHSHDGYFVTVGVMATLAVVLLVTFRARKWI